MYNVKSFLCVTEILPTGEEILGRKTVCRNSRNWCRTVGGKRH